MGHAEVMKIVSKYLKTQLSVMNFSTVKTCGGSIPLVSQHPIGSPLSAGNSGLPRLYCVIPYLSWEIVTSLYSTVKATTKNHVFFCRPHFFILTLPIDRTHWAERFSKALNKIGLIDIEKIKLYNFRKYHPQINLTDKSDTSNYYGIPTKNTEHVVIAVMGLPFLIVTVHSLSMLVWYRIIIVLIEN